MFVAELCKAAKTSKRFDYLKARSLPKSNWKGIGDRAACARCSSSHRHDFIAQLARDLLATARPNFCRRETAAGSDFAFEEKIEQMRYERHVAPVADLICYRSIVERYSIEPAATGQRSCTADSNKADLNGNRAEPSVLVPSGNRTTTEPQATALRIRLTTAMLDNLCSRSTKMVPAACASQPKNGHVATSRLATKTHGRIELITTTSR